MKIMTSFRHLNSHGKLRAREIIAAEAQLLEKHLTRFPKDLVHLEATVSQTRGKTRIGASLRLHLPSGVLAAHEEGFEIKPVLRDAFATLRHQVERHVARLKHESDWKRPARRRRIGAPLPPVRNAEEAKRRSLFFDLIEDHLDTVYDTVRRELTYLEASGSVPEGYLSVCALVDATILAALDRFEQRPNEFSIGDWLKQLAFETIEAEAQAARCAVPEDAASIDAEPEMPAEEPTESDQEMFEFYQPDDVLLLEELVADDTEDSPETAAAEQETALVLHRAIAGLPARWRRVLFLVDMDETPLEKASEVLGIPEDDLSQIAQSARAYLRDKLLEFGNSPDTAVEAMDRARTHKVRIPAPLQDRTRIEQAFLGSTQGEAS